MRLQIGPRQSGGPFLVLAATPTTATIFSTPSVPRSSIGWCAEPGIPTARWSCDITCDKEWASPQKLEIPASSGCAPEQV